MKQVELFQFTRPAWGATIPTGGASKAAKVSIHAPRVGRDLTPYGVHFITDVSIHAPRVGRDDDSGRSWENR